MHPDIAATAALTYPAGASASEVTRDSQTVDGAYSGGMPCLVQSRFCPEHSPRHTERDARSWLHNHVFKQAVVSGGADGGAALDFQSAGGGVYGLALAPRQESDEPHGHVHARLLLDVEGQSGAKKSDAKAPQHGAPKQAAAGAAKGKGAAPSPPLNAKPDGAARREDAAANGGKGSKPAAGSRKEGADAQKRGAAPAPARTDRKSASDSEGGSAADSAAQPPAKSPKTNASKERGKPQQGDQRGGGDEASGDDGNFFSDTLKAWGWDFSWQDLKERAWSVFPQSGADAGGWAAQMALDGATCTPGWVPLLVGDGAAGDGDVVGWRAGPDTWRARCVQPVPLALNQPTQVRRAALAMGLPARAGCMLLLAYEPLAACFRSHTSRRHGDCCRLPPAQTQVRVPAGLHAVRSARSAVLQVRGATWHTLALASSAAPLRQ